MGDQTELERKVHLVNDDIDFENLYETVHKEKDRKKEQKGDSLKRNHRQHFTVDTDILEHVHESHPHV